MIKMRVKRFSNSKLSRSITAVLLVIAMLISVLPVTAAAQPTDSSVIEQLAERTLSAIIYTDQTYKTPASDAASITVSGRLPEDISAKAYAVSVEEENVCAAYDITLFDASGSEYEPTEAVSVEISSLAISDAVDCGEQLSAFHIKDDKTTESIDLTVTDDSGVSFEAESFSIYYITSSTETPKIYRRTYKFKNLSPEENSTTYEPYYFNLEKNGSTKRTDEQIIKNGESLVLPQLPNHGMDTFAGWFIGGDNGNPDLTKKVQFNTPINDITQDETVTIYACYGIQKLITFFYSAPEKVSDEKYSTPTIFYTFPVVIPDGESSVDVYLYDYISHRTDGAAELTGDDNDLRHVKAPIPSNRNVFLGWSKNKVSSYTSVANDDFLTDPTSSIRQECVDNKKITVTKASTEADLTFYPVFDTAVWVNFDEGNRSSGASYQAPIYILKSEREKWDTLPAVSRKGYQFEGWYYDAAWDSATQDGNYEYETSNGAKKVTEGVLKANENSQKTVAVVNNGSVNGAYDITGNGTYYFAPTTSNEKGITLHALWSESITDYTIVYWAQRPWVIHPNEVATLKERAEAQNATQADKDAYKDIQEKAETRMIDSLRLSNYDYIGFKRISEYDNNGTVKVKTGDTINLSTKTLGFDPDYPQSVTFKNKYKNTDYDDPTKFFYNDEKTIGNNTSVTVAADGSTVINVYYDRTVHQWDFDTRVYKSDGHYVALGQYACQYYYRPSYYENTQYYDRVFQSSERDYYLTEFNSSDVTELGNNTDQVQIKIYKNTNGYYLGEKKIFRKYDLQKTYSIYAVYEHEILDLWPLATEDNPNRLWNGYLPEKGEPQMTATKTYMSNYDRLTSLSGDEIGVETGVGEGDNKSNPFLEYEPTTRYTLYDRWFEEVLDENSRDNTNVYPSVPNREFILSGYKNNWSTQYGWADDIPGFRIVNVTGSSSPYYTTTDNWGNTQEYGGTRDIGYGIISTDSNGSDLDRVSNAIYSNIDDPSAGVTASTPIYGYFKDQNSNNKNDLYTDYYFKRKLHDIHLMDSLSLTKTDLDSDLESAAEYISITVPYDAPPPVNFQDPNYLIAAVKQASGNTKDFGTYDPETQTITRVKDGVKYRFEGFYLDPFCQGTKGGDPTLLTKVFDENLNPVGGEGFTTMPDRDVFIFANWVPIDYKVDIETNYGQLSQTESTYFNLKHGEKIQEYRDISRPYVEAKTSEISTLGDSEKYYYIYVERPADEDDYTNDRRAVYVSAEDYASNAVINGLHIRDYIDENGDTQQYTLENDPRVMKNNANTAPLIFKEDPMVGTGDNKVNTYKLTGWYRDDNGKLDLYNFDTQIESDTKLTVLWQNNKKYAVEYIANEYEADGKTIKYYGHLTNNGSSEYFDQDGDSAILTYAEGASALIKFAAEAGDENKRAQFIYWTIDGDESNARYSINDLFVVSPDLASDEVTIDGETMSVIRLRAHYSTLEQVGVRYDANNNGENSDRSGVFYYPNNSEVTLHNAVQDGFTNDGKIIVGWCNMRDPSAEGAVIYDLEGKYGIDGEGTAESNGVTTLYAVWSDPVKVTYHTKGGTWEDQPTNVELTSVDVSSADKTYETTIAKNSYATDPDNTPAKEGYTFKFWTTDPNALLSSTPYSFDSAVTEDIDLYAVYESDTAVKTRTIDVRYFYFDESTGTIVEVPPTENPQSFWNSNKSNIKTQLTISSNTSTKVFREVYSASYQGGTLNLLDCVNTGANITGYTDVTSKNRTVAVGIGHAGSYNEDIDLYAANMLKNGDVLSKYSENGLDSYVKYATGSDDVLWSPAENGEYSRFDDDPAIYVIIYPQNSTQYSYKSVTVQNTVSGEGSSVNDVFEYTATIKNNSGETVSTETFTLKQGETHTISLLTNSSDPTKNQTVTITQTKEANSHYSLASITDDGTKDLATKTVTLTSSDSGTVFNNVYTKSDPAPTPKNDTITVTNTLFDKNGSLTDYPNDVKIYNADNKAGNTATIGVRITDSSGNFVKDLDEVEYSDGQIRFSASELEDYKTAGYKLELTLGVQNPNDLTVSSIKTHVDADDNGTKSAVTSGGTADKNGITWSKGSGDGVVSCDISSLFDNNDDLTASKLDFVTQAKTELVPIIYKYYDRVFNTNASVKLDIDPNSKTVNRNGRFGRIKDDKGDAVSNVDRVAETIMTSSPNVTNVLDEVYFFTSQQNAYDALTATGENRIALRDASVYSDAYENAESATHTDRYGNVVAGGEKWVTYNNDNSRTENKAVTLTDDTQNITDDIYTVTEIVVWGFNVPRKYSVNYVVPENEEQLIEASVKGGSVYVADDTKSPANLFNSYYYNQRVGAVVGASDDLRNGGCAYLDEYGMTFNNGLSSYIDVPDINGKEFEGWYVKDGEKFVKVSSDKQYGERITKDIVLYAGYTDSAETVSVPTEGISLTKNAVERYTDAQGNLNYRYVTLLNGYGYEDNDERLTNAALLYVVLPSDTDPEDIPDIKTILDTVNGTTDNEEALIDAINAHLNGKAFAAMTVVHSENQNIVISDKTNTIGYGYNIIREGDDSATGDIVFTNKNRTQFSLTMNSANVERDGKYSKLLAMAAVKCDGSWQFSDNYILYANGE